MYDPQIDSKMLDASSEEIVNTRKRVSIVNVRNIFNAVREHVKLFSKFVSDAIGIFSFPLRALRNLERLFIFSADTHHRSTEYERTRVQKDELAVCVPNRSPRRIHPAIPRYSLADTNCRREPDNKSTGSTGSRRRSLPGGLTSAIPINRSRSVHAIPLLRRLNLLIHPQGPSVTCSLPCVYFFSTPTVGQMFRSQNSLSHRSNNNGFYRSNSRQSDSG